MEEEEEEEEECRKDDVLLISCYLLHLLGEFSLRQPPLTD